MKLAHEPLNQNGDGCMLVNVEVILLTVNRAACCEIEWKRQTSDGQKIIEISHLSNNDEHKNNDGRNLAFLPRLCEFESACRLNA